MNLRARWQERLLTQQWRLAVRARRPGPRAFLDPAGYQLLPQPSDEFRADPFLVEHGADTWIFFERYRFREAKGHIAAGRLVESAAGDYSLVDVVTALERTCHLSFPCIFRAEDTLWMVPESVQQRSVELYRCLHFPHRWELERTLLSDVSFADCTVFRLPDPEPVMVSPGEAAGPSHRWAMLAAELQPAPGEPYRHALRVLTASTPQGPWTELPRPIAEPSSTGTRSAGAVFLDPTGAHGSRLVWPTQDCTERYGGAIRFRNLDSLAEGLSSGLAEKLAEPFELGSLEPDPGTGSRGVHTYAQSSRFEAIDQLHPVFAPGLKLRGLLGKAGRRLGRRPAASTRPRQP